MNTERTTEPPSDFSRIALRATVFAVTLGFIGLLGFGLVAQAPDTTIDDAILSGAQTAAPGFLGVNQQDATEDALAFLDEFSVSYPNVREAGKDTSRSYGLTGFPETFFVSPAGKIVGHVIGIVDASQLRRGIAAAQAGAVVELGTGGARQDAP